MTNIYKSKKQNVKIYVLIFDTGSMTLKAFLEITSPDVNSK